MIKQLTYFAFAGIVLGACSASPANRVTTPTYAMLADKCFAGYTFYRNRRSDLKMCFNDAGTHAFYTGKRNDPDGNLADYKFDAPVEIDGDGKVLLRSFLRDAPMTVTRSGDGRLRMRGNYTYQKDEGGSMFLEEVNAEEARQLQQILDQ